MRHAMCIAGTDCRQQASAAKPALLRPQHGLNMDTQHMIMTRDTLAIGNALTLAYLLALLGYGVQTGLMAPLDDGVLPEAGWVGAGLYVIALTLAGSTALLILWRYHTQRCLYRPLALATLQATLLTILLGSWFLFAA